MKPIPKAKPCPFCGNKKITYMMGEDGWFIGCFYRFSNQEACHASLGGIQSKKKLLEQWNKRTTVR